MSQMSSNGDLEGGLQIVIDQRHLGTGELHQGTRSSPQFIEAHRSCGVMWELRSLSCQSWRQNITACIWAESIRLGKQIPSVCAFRNRIAFIFVTSPGPAGTQRGLYRVIETANEENIEAAKAKSTKNVQ